MSHWARSYPILVSLLISPLAGPAQAQLTDPDWKYYGNIPANAYGPEKAVFFDSNSVAKLDGHVVQAWAKTLPDDAVQKILEAKEPDKDLVEATARKVAAHYLPPIAAVKHLTSEQAFGPVMYETVAQLGKVVWADRLLIQIDCSAATYRVVRASFLDKEGTVAYSDTATQWEPVPPESTASNLARMVCKGPASTE